ncbi:uracil-DNA glycosylase [Biomphalaria pfeifferi]|uniref:Uracil-DNA glycosylase n=1 Tax=Biomphalaria pfeifferi TaxID=112525 RepID=A0AAD8FPP2_BIOPF|nr:uracil-DNA glycosylase [Biomphalaria pfeifferi]
MSQTKISTFFQSPKARSKSKCANTSLKPESETDVVEVRCRKGTAVSDTKDEQPSKKYKVEQELGQELSDDLKEKVAQNKIHAKIKLLGSKTNGLVVNIGPSWYTALESEFSKEYFIKLSQFIGDERKKSTIFPPADQVFTWTTTCAISSVKVVIIGQDPYHGQGQAHGLCFSVLPGVKPPPSLENIFKELEGSIDGFKHPGHGNLIGWARQGVLLLNACLTVKEKQPNSHAGKGWEQFTDAVINWLNSNLKGVVFMLWGAYAQKKGSRIDKKKHHILTAVHPSPLSAHKGFIGCKHFSTCNELLKKDGKIEINWTLLPAH